MKKFFALLMLAVSLLFSNTIALGQQIIANPQTFFWKEEDCLAKVFSQAEVEGTFVLYDLSAQVVRGYNHKRAEKQFFPASTFKIANSLIGLQSGVVKSVNDILPYGGQPQRVKAWESDMSLKDAIKVSNVPVYQELARRIGLKRMQAGVVSLNYGNKEIGEKVDEFWLEGPLQISALEQTWFLAQLAKEQLPVPKSDQQAVKEIIKLESNASWTLYGKTGTSAKNNPPINWWVGWVEKANNIYAFAININAPSNPNKLKALENSLGQRVAPGLGKLCLKELNIIN